MKKYWSKDEEQFLTENLGKYTYDELSDIFNVEKAKIIDKVHKMGLNRKIASGEIWSKEEDQLLAQHFEWAPKNKLLLLFPNRTWPSITQRGWKTLNLVRLSQDKYDIDYNFFSEWNEKSAYIFGFLAADGYLKYESGSRNETSVQIELAWYDKDILYKIKEALSYEGEIRESSRGTYKLSFANKKLCKDLIEKGMPPNDKTNKMAWPESLPDELASHFIRGLFDGDGSIYLEKDRKNPSYQFLGTESILIGIKNQLPIRMEKHSIYDRNHCGANVHCLKISNGSCKQIFEYMYKDATIYLDRKYNKAKELFN